MGSRESIAFNEARTRSELVREAVRIYIERKKEWESLFRTGANIASTLEIQEKDVMKEIKKHRKQKAK